jgi:catechol 2,3-dioxygenase-like lactoylglutathione lyase family enzyme
MDRAYAWLRKHGVEHSSPEPQTLPAWNPNAGGIKAFYFKDPDGHPLEILWFPQGKGAAKWHGPTDRLFLGIDHTAIVVGDTEASLAYYRDTLGLRVSGESENYGIEQERLNNVFGARLRITGLQASAGPGIEFLEYMTPRDGRPFPADERANDIVRRKTRLVVRDAGAAALRLRSRRHQLISPDAVTLPDPSFGSRRAFLARDPDGHVLELFERAN